MTASALFSTVAEMGIHLTANGDRLRLDAPAGALTPELRRELSDHKAELLALLKGEPPSYYWRSPLATWPDDRRERWGRKAR